MAGRRITPARLAGIAAWSAASVTWGTAIVAAANAQPATADVDAVAMPEPEPVVVAAEVVPSTTVPTVPESGLVVLRYTPVEKPQAQVVVRKVVVSGGGGGGGGAPATSAPAPSQPTKTKSSGS